MKAIENEIPFANQIKSKFVRNRQHTQKSSLAAHCSLTANKMNTISTTRLFLSHANPQQLATAIYSRAKNIENKLVTLPRL